jgi:DNA-binding winged helix-turn-helix (wHTH) protein
LPQAGIEAIIRPKPEGAPFGGFHERRQTNAGPFRFGPFEADLQSCELRKHGVRIKLQDQPFRILAMLLQRPGETITREELRQQLWPDGTFVEYEHSLNTSINKLRAALNDSADAPRYIETLQRRGYRFVGAVERPLPSSTAPTEAGAATAKEVLDEGAADGAINHRRPLRRAAWILLPAAGAILLVGAGIAGRWMRSPAQTKRTVRFSLSAPANWALSPAPPAVSPDGSSLAFLAARDGRRVLWLRPIDAVSSHPILGTEGATTVFWSPDGRFVAFIAGGKLKKVELGTGQLSSLCDAASNSAGTWHPDGTILFQPSYSGPLFRVSADGGVPVPATSLSPDRGDMRHAWPQWLPDGTHFLYYIDTQKTETTGIYAGSRDLNVPAELIIASSPGGGVYVPGRDGRKGHLLFVRGESLMAGAAVRCVASQAARRARASRGRLGGPFVGLQVQPGVFGVRGWCARVPQRFTRPFATCVAGSKRRPNGNDCYVGCLVSPRSIARPAPDRLRSA